MDKLLQVVTNGIQSAEKNSDKPLTESEKKFVALHEISHEIVKAERTYNVAKDFAINDIMNKNDYIYRGGNDAVSYTHLTLPTRS